MQFALKSAAQAAERQMSYGEWMNRRPDRIVRSRHAFIEAFMANADANTQTESTLALIRGEYVLTHTATPVFVTASAHEMIAEAADSLPNDEVLLASERDSRPLMLWFEQPYRYALLAGDGMGDFVNEDWLVDCLSIQPVNDMLTTALPNDRGPGIQVTVYGRPYNTAAIDVDEFFRSEGGMIPVDVIGIRCGIAWHNHDAHWVVALKKWIIAMYRLMGDHIEQERVHIDRAARRRLTRLSFPEDGYITEIRLRKAVYSDERKAEGEAAPLRFRHRVRGHWRKFYCPSTGLPTGAPEAYRHRYVNDYVRGPRSAPMVESTQVVTLAR